MTVSHDADKVADALHGAIARLIRALESDLGRARDARGRDSIRSEPTG